MGAREIIELELDQMKMALKGARERLVQLQNEVEQLAGAVSFGEYLLDQLNRQETPAEEE